MPGGVEYKTFGIYPVIGTQTAATGSWTGIIDVPQLYDGLTIAYYLPYAGSGNATLNLTLSDGSTTGAVNCYYTDTSRLTTQYGAGSVIILTYFSAGSISVTGTDTAEDRWLHCDYNTNTVPAAYCSTAAGTAAKAATCSGYALLANSYLHIVMTNSNTSASALTLNVNSKGAKPIYINGAASSATNYTLPAGSYLIYYNGTNYYFNTDGKLPILYNSAITSVQDAMTSIQDAMTSIQNVVANLHIEQSVVIQTSDWSKKTCTKTVSGVTSSNTIIVSPNASSFIAYGEAQVRATAQGTNQVTFTCTDIPTSSLTVNIAILN